jgi:hypothetical protein
LQSEERTYNKLHIKYQEAIDSGKPEDMQGWAQQLKDGKPLLHAFSLALRSLNEGLRLQFFFYEQLCVITLMRRDGRA